MVSRRVISVTIIVVLLVVLVSGYIGVTYNNGNQSTENSAKDARDSVITYLTENYPVTQNWTANLGWTGGRQNTSTAELEAYVYSTSEWTMQLNCSVTSNRLYIVDANYTKDNVTLDWMGACQNGTVAEQGLVVYNNDFVAVEPNQATVNAIQYLAQNHQETAPYLAFSGLTGGRVVPPEGFVGSETYSYVMVNWNQTDMYRAGWTITVQYPVIPNPVYSLNVTYVPPNTEHAIVDWQGTWQNGTITERLYSFTP